MSVCWLGERGGRRWSQAGQKQRQLMARCTIPHSPLSPAPAVLAGAHTCPAAMPPAQPPRRFFILELFMSLTVVESLMMAIAPLVPHYLMGIAAGAGGLQ